MKRASLEAKEANVLVDPAVPPLLDEEFDGVRVALEDSLKSPSQPSTPIPEYAPEDAVLYFAPSSKSVGPWVAITDVHRRLSGTSMLSIEDEVRECFVLLRGMPLFALPSFLRSHVRRSFKGSLTGLFALH